MPENHARVIILGAGPAGYTAALYAARANLEPMLITGEQPGGQLTITTDVENFPGFADTIQGGWLMEQMSLQVERAGARIVFDTVSSADLSAHPMELASEFGETYTCDALIIATGAKARWLGIPGEADFQGAGVSGCATCDGFAFKGRTVAVVGGGNSAVEEALFLTNLASKVTLIHRRETLRAEAVLQSRLLAHPNVEVVWGSLVEEVLGDGSPDPKMASLRLRHVQTGVVSDLAVDGLFVAVGHDPATEMFKGQLDLDANGYIQIGNWSTRASEKPVWAAGDVADSKYRQAVTAAGMGCMAALEVQKWFAEQSADLAEAERERAEPSMPGAWSAITPGSGQSAAVTGRGQARS